MQLAPGTNLGPYTIQKFIGSGGMGTVYLAYDTRLERRVALKLLTHAVPEEGARHLKREARAIARLNHPNIAALYDVVEHESRPFLVMEYVDGESVSQLAKAQPVPIERVIDIGIQLAEALAYAHQAGIIHRDIKPSNVMLTPAGRLKVLDLGLAQATTPDPGADTHSLSDADAYSRAGTPAYMAPERLSASPADQRTDVYSAGVLLYELLTGERPYAAPDLISLAFNIATHSLPHVSAVRADVPPALDAVIAKAMAKDANERTASAAELRDALVSVRAGRDDASTPKPLIDSVAALGRARSSRLIRGLAAAGLVAAVAIAVITWLGGRPPPTSEPALFMLFSTVQAGTDDGELDRVSDLVGSVLAGNLSNIPNVTLVAPPVTHAPAYSTAVVFRRTVPGLSAEIEMRRGAAAEPVWQERFEGDVSSVLSSLVSGVVATLQREQLLSRLTLAMLSRVRQLPTQRPDALTLYLRGMTTLDTSTNAETDRTAIADFSAAIALDPSFALAHAALSRGHFSLLKYDTTSQAARSYAKDAALKAVALDRFCDQAHVAASFVYSDLKQHEDAIRHAREAIRLNPDADDGYRALGLALLGRGHEGDTKEGFAALEWAAARRPRHWTNLYTLGRELLRRQRYQEAIGPYKAVTSLRPNFANSFVNLSVAYSALGQFDMAIGVLQRAVALQPNDSAALNNLATAFYWTGRYADALPIYIEAVRKDPSAVRYMNLGDGYDRLKRASEARSAYERAVEQADKEVASSRDPRAMAISAKCAAKLGRGSDAERRALMAMSEAPDDAEVRYKLAVVYALNGQIADALEALEKAIALKYPLVYIRLDRDLSALANHPKFKALIAARND